MACDKLASNCYLWSATDGKVYVSSSGHEWSHASTTPRSSAGYPGYLQVDYTTPGHLCICLGDSGLWCSSDSGRSFKRQTDMFSCRMLDWGAAHPRWYNHSSMYVFGRPTNATLDEAVYLRLNGSWRSVSTPGVGLGESIHGPMQAGKRSFGDLFFGTSGAGVVHGRLLG
jgi:hypothetical protein